mgnify:CR=1 FL=1
MTEFDKASKQFQEEWQQSMRVARAYGIVGISIGLLGLCFFGWVIVVLLRFIGAI